jgi:hypothetical protein
MSLTQYPPLCNQQCGSFILPDVNFEDCNPEIHESQIEKIYVCSDLEAPLNDWNDASEWATRLAQTAGTATSIRELTVIGDMPLPEKTEKVISGGRKVQVNKDRTINFDIDELNDINYDAAISLQCAKKVKIWFQTRSGHLFGGNEGIDADLDLDLFLSRAEGDIQLFQGTLKWKSDFAPRRIVSPIA